MISLRRVLLLVLALTAALTVICWRRGAEERPARNPTVATAPVRSAVQASDPPSGGVVGLSSTPKHLSSALRGGDLAVAWLQGYLTRSSRDDDRWQSAIANLSSPELVAELRESGPNWVGLNRLDSWGVARIQAFRVVGQPVDTSSRISLGYVVTVTDGHHAIEKPFVLYAYRQLDDRWLISLVDQPYASEG